MRRFPRSMGCARALLLVAAPVCVWAALLGAAPPAMAAGEPVSVTGNATVITSTSATLNGTVNPDGQATTYYFEYGTTTSYGSQTAVTGTGSGTTDVKISAAVDALVPNTTYHYRLVAANAAGTALGSDVAFKTPKPPVPVASTGRVSAVTQTSATLTGSVNPKGEATSYAFEYGTSSAYGSQTPTASAGSGTANVAVSATIGSLTPGTTYHYRLVATSVNGTTRGRDVAFKTTAVPAGVTLAAVPDPITFGELVSLSGHVLSPRPPRPTVTLQSAPGAGGPWTDVATTPAGSTGAFAFSGLAPSAQTFYRVLSAGATSPTVLVSVRFRIGLLVSRTHPRAGSRVRLHGRVAPGHPGQLVLIQRLGPHGHWHTVRLTRLRGSGGGFSFYSVMLRVHRSGRWRALVLPDATHAMGLSRPVRIRLH